MKLTAADWTRVYLLVVGLGGIVTGPALAALGLPQNTATHIAAIFGYVVVIATLVYKIFATPSPPAGTNYAVIPQGTIPAVGTSTGGGPAVAHIDPATSTVVPLSVSAGQPKAPS